MGLFSSIGKILGSVANTFVPGFSLLSSTGAFGSTLQAHAQGTLSPNVAAAASSNLAVAAAVLPSALPPPPSPTSAQWCFWGATPHAFTPLPVAPPPPPPPSQPWWASQPAVPYGYARTSTYAPAPTYAPAHRFDPRTVGPPVAPFQAYGGWF